MDSYNTAVSEQPTVESGASLVVALADLAAPMLELGTRFSSLANMMQDSASASFSSQPSSPNVLEAGSTAETGSNGSGVDGQTATTSSPADEKAIKFSETVEGMKKGWSDLLEYMNQTEKASAEGTADAWLTRVQNATKGSKKLQAVHRAAAIAQAVRNTALGITAAFKGPPDGPPFPANIAMAALVAARGATELAAIKGQAHDGINNVPSTGTYLLEKGERVVDKRLNRDLSHYLEGQRPEVLNKSSQSITHSPSVNLTINGNPDPDAVRSNRGALESMIREIYADHALTSPFD